MMNNNYQPLTPQIANQISHDLGRLQELYDTTIETPTKEQEIKALEASVAQAMFTFAPCFIGAWFIKHTEYEPLMGALATGFSRVQQIIDNRNRIMAARAAAQKQPADASPAIIQLPKA